MSLIKNLADSGFQMKYTHTYIHTYKHIYIYIYILHKMNGVIFFAYLCLFYFFISNIY